MSKRWRAFCDGHYPQISSIVALPKDIYDNVLFHSEILIFNIDGLKPHYFYDGQL
jgi:type I restriction enzyme M protein